MSDEPILTPETSASKRKRKTIRKATTEKRESSPKVVVGFKGKGNSRQVTQLQLEQLIYAKRKLREARQAYEQIRREIEQELISGATIERGVHTASVVSSERLTVR